jgi:hypothetical protein
MTYQSQGLIQAQDYNNFVGNGVSGPNLNATWSSAYSQTALPTVAPGGTVLASNWSTLNTTAAVISTHTGVGITNRGPGPVAQSIISIQTNLASDITNLYNNRLSSYALGTQFIGWTGTASQTAQTGLDNVTAWTITFTDTVTFPNVSATTAFWNAGGCMKIQFNKTSGTNSVDVEWNNFVNNICGTVYLTSDSSSKTLGSLGTVTGVKVVGGSGTPTVNNYGWNQLNSSPQIIYKQTDNTYTYTGDYVQVTAAATNSTTLTLVTTWYGAARGTSGTSRAISGGTGISPGTTTFNGAPTTLVTAYYPETTSGLTNTWSPIAIASTVSAPAYS